MIKHFGSDDCLLGMPGDTLYYTGDNGTGSGIIKVAGWSPLPNGGKVWTYELTSGMLVSSNSVTRVEKLERAVIRVEPSIFDAQNDFMKSLELVEMSAILKTAIFCVASGDLENLKVAKFLIERRVKELQILSE